jgi:hypothetical protein
MGIPGPRAASRTVLLCSDKVFLWRLVLSAWALRIGIVVIFQLTDAIRRLRLSPDSEKYHRNAVEIMQDMHYGNFNGPAWIDNGWFQFTGFVYWLLGPWPFVMQLLNTIIGAVTVIPLFLIMRRLTPDVRTQRFYGLLVAFFPSIVYWSCLMLKDPASILALALIVYGVVELRLKFRLWPLFWTVFGLLIYLGTRLYLFTVLIMLMPFAFLIFPRKMSLRALVLPAVIGIVPVVFGLGYFASGAFANSLYFDLDYINHVRTVMGDHGGSALFDADEVHIWGQDLGSDVLAVFRTAFAVFFPVNPFDVQGTRQMMALPFVFMMGYMVFLCGPGAMRIWRARKVSTPVMLFGTAVLGVYIGGTTNAGALFRWTTQIMPYILMAATLGLYLKDRPLQRWANRMVIRFARVPATRRVELARPPR